MLSWDGKELGNCKQCGDPITNKFLIDHCLACLEKAVDKLTTDDIALAMADLVNK
jgi:hypothetical protein